MLCGHNETRLEIKKIVNTYKAKKKSQGKYFFKYI